MNNLHKKVLRETGKFIHALMAILILWGIIGVSIWGITSYLDLVNSSTEFVIAYGFSLGFIVMFIGYVTFIIGQAAYQNVCSVILSVQMLLDLKKSEQ